MQDIDATRGGFVLRRMAFGLRRALLLAGLLAGFLLLGSLVAGAYADTPDADGPLDPADTLAASLSGPEAGSAETGTAAGSADGGADSGSSSDSGSLDGSGAAPEGDSGGRAESEHAESVRAGAVERSVEDLLAEAERADGTTPADVARAAAEIVDEDTRSGSESIARKATSEPAVPAERPAEQVAAITERLVEAAELVGQQVDEPQSVLVEAVVHTIVPSAPRPTAPSMKQIAEPTRPVQLEPDVVTPTRAVTARGADPVTAPPRPRAPTPTTPPPGAAAPVGPADPTVTGANAAADRTASGASAPAPPRPAPAGPVAPAPLAPALTHSPSAGGDGHGPRFLQAVLGNLPAALLVIDALTIAAGSPQLTWWFPEVAVGPD